ncbi:hypothetical protein Tco_0343217 [Tanacetum coccineum]
MALDHDNSGPAPHLQKASDHNCLEPKIQDHINEPSSSKLVPEVVPTADTIDTSLQELELLFSPMYDEYFNGGNQGRTSSIPKGLRSLGTLIKQFRKKVIDLKGLWKDKKDDKTTLSFTIRTSCVRRQAGRGHALKNH